MTEDREPDIVEIIMKMAQSEGLNADAAQMIEHAIRSNYGGMRIRIPKRKKHPTPEQRQRVFQDGLSGMKTEEITEKHGISRRTLYYLMKKGPA